MRLANTKMRLNVADTKIAASSKKNVWKHKLALHNGNTPDHQGETMILNTHDTKA